MKKLRVPNHIVELLQHLHPEIKKKIKTALKNILKNPEVGKSLHCELEGLCSYRVGTLRIVYKSTSDIIEIVAIGPRRSIYEATYQLLKKSKTQR